MVYVGLHGVNGIKRICNIQMQYLIHLMQRADIPIIAEIEAQIHAHPWTMGMFFDAFDAHYTGWVLKDNDEISAYLIVQFIVDECHILTIGVKKDKQRRGYGQALLDFLWTNKPLNCHKILLEVQESNIPAIQLYQQSGFQRIGIRKHYYKDESALIFEKIDGQ